MDQMGLPSLEWALSHILRFGDTDIFPIPFEYQAIKHCWNIVADKLIDRDLTDYQCRASYRMLVPKPSRGYRVAVQLDPIDALVYTSSVYEVAELIERQRVPIERKVACSYRINIDSKGLLFRNPSECWNDFHSHSEELATSGLYSYVVVTDIADFYNQVSHHRVRNALELSNIPADRARNIENFLMSLSGGHSQGIPVGPSASIILAEACLDDVDTRLLRKGYIHTRYVDDIRIFCKTRFEAHQALHDLSDYLDTAHRLTLQSSKTRVYSIGQFIENELSDPEKLENQAKTRKVAQLLAELSMFYQAVEIPEDSEVLRGIAVETLAELFGISAQSPVLHQGLMRYILRKATELRTNVLHSHVLNNLEYLSPIMRDAAYYLSKTTQQKTSTHVGKALINFMRDSDLRFMPFIRIWIVHTLLNEKFGTEFEHEISELCDETDEKYGIRLFALLARQVKYLDWVREQKETWQSNRPWDKRAVIWSATVLSDDERRNWLARVQNRGDLLDEVVAKAIM